MKTGKVLGPDDKRGDKAHARVQIVEPEKYVRVAQDIYEDSKTVVGVG